MKLTITDNNSFQTSAWSGGTTTQLYISPKNASYADRNFNLRISTANVVDEESTFTSLPDVHRQLMILEGEIDIHHHGHYKKHLKPFDIDTFEGDWITTAKGKCKDFNVMTTGDIQFKLMSLEFTANNYFEITVEKKWSYLILYLFKGRLHIDVDQKRHLLNQGSLLVAEKLDIFQFPIKSLDHCQIIITKIK